MNVYICLECCKMGSMQTGWFGAPLMEYLESCASSVNWVTMGFSEATSIAQTVILKEFI